MTSSAKSVGDVMMVEHPAKAQEAVVFVRGIPVQLFFLVLVGTVFFCLGLCLPMIQFC